MSPILLHFHNVPSVLSSQQREAEAHATAVRRKEEEREHRYRKRMARALEAYKGAPFHQLTKSLLAAGDLHLDISLSVVYFLPCHALCVSCITGDLRSPSNNFAVDALGALDTGGLFIVQCDATNAHTRSYTYINILYIYIYAAEQARLEALARQQEEQQRRELEEMQRQQVPLVYVDGAKKHKWFSPRLSHVDFNLSLPLRLDLPLGRCCFFRRWPTLSACLSATSRLSKSKRSRKYGSRLKKSWSVNARPGWRSFVSRLEAHLNALLVCLRLTFLLTPPLPSAS